MVHGEGHHDQRVAQHRQRQERRQQGGHPRGEVAGVRPGVQPWPGPQPPGTRVARCIGLPAVGGRDDAGLARSGRWPKRCAGTQREETLWCGDLLQPERGRD